MAMNRHVAFAGSSSKHGKETFASLPFDTSRDPRATYENNDDGFIHFTPNVKIEGDEDVFNKFSPVVFAKSKRRMLGKVGKSRSTGDGISIPVRDNKCSTVALKPGPDDPTLAVFSRSKVSKSDITPELPVMVPYRTPSPPSEVRPAMRSPPCLYRAATMSSSSSSSFLPILEDSTKMHFLPLLPKLRDDDQEERVLLSRPLFPMKRSRSPCF